MIIISFIAVDIVLDILKIVALPIMFWAILIGTIALCKGWPKIFKNDDSALMYALKVFVIIVSVLTWMFIIVNGSQLLMRNLTPAKYINKMF